MPHTQEKDRQAHEHTLATAVTNIEVNKYKKQEQGKDNNQHIKSAFTPLFHHVSCL